MSQIKKVTELSEPVETGRWYLVPTVLYEWHGRIRDWPVFLPRHSDQEFFNFADAHYHIDPRFLTQRDFDYGDRSYRGAWGTFQAAPLALTKWVDGERTIEPHPAVVWKRRRCRAAHIPYQFGATDEVKKLRSAYAGHQCAHSKGGWICPHQHYALGSVQPDEDGQVTCPLHGLRINTVTGVAL